MRVMTGTKRGKTGTVKCRRDEICSPEMLKRPNI
jgi:hypothetical protein